MKQVLLLLLLFASVKGFSCVLNITQNNWRWRNNDGNENSATWKAGQSTAATYNTNQGVIRLRVEVMIDYRNRDPLSGQCFNSAYTLRDLLQYTTESTNGSSWENITNDPSKAFMLAGTDSFITQGMATTPQISGASNAFSAGRVMVSDNTTNFAIDALGRTEVEWAIVGTANMLPNTNYYFRHAGPIQFFRWYSSYPSLITTTPLPIKLTNFTLTGEGSKARLEWVTASEQNNDRFEVQRSPDQRTWQTIAIAKGKGNSTTPVSYTAYDDKPLSSTSYYRLQQFDEDGRSTFSETRFFKPTVSSAIISVWPNPVKDVINFSLGHTGAVKLEAVLSNASGKIIYRKTCTCVQANTVNTLTLPQKPAPGIYLLQLNGNDISECLKIVVP